jgi:hypothetical protein
VVITVLRATTSVIKEICVSTLFNLLSHEAYREECVRDGEAHSAVLKPDPSVY